MARLNSTVLKNEIKPLIDKLKKASSEQEFVSRTLELREKLKDFNPRLQIDVDRSIKPYFKILVQERSLTTFKNYGELEKAYSQLEFRQKELENAANKTAQSSLVATSEPPQINNLPVDPALVKNQEYKEEPKQSSSVESEQGKNKKEQQSTDINNQKKEVKSDVSARHPAIVNEITQHRSRLRIFEKYENVKLAIERQIDYAKSSNPIYKTTDEVSKSIRIIKKELFSIDIADKNQRIKDSIVSFVGEMEDYEENRLTEANVSEFQTVLETGLSNIDAAISRVNQEALAIRKAVDVNAWNDTLDSVRANTPETPVDQSAEKLSGHVEAKSNNDKRVSTPNPQMKLDEGIAQSTVDTTQQTLKKAETKANSAGAVQPNEKDIANDGFQATQQKNKTENKPKKRGIPKPKAAESNPQLTETKAVEATKSATAKPKQSSYLDMFSKLKGKQQAAVVGVGLVGAGGMIGSGVYLGQNVEAIQHGVEAACNGVDKLFTGTNPHVQIDSVGAEIIIGIVLLIGVAGLISLLQSMIESMSATNNVEAKFANHPNHNPEEQSLTLGSSASMSLAGPL